jgi:predicted NACHT family NTPase
VPDRIRTYNWTRLWRERSSDADAPPDAVSREGETYEQIARLPCLVLLGEPGMGKSHELRADWETLHCASSDDNIPCWRDLNAYTTSDDLVRDVFESEPFASWISGTHNLTLFLDSLDECKIEIKPVAKRLGVELTRYATDRLRLRIACRTADWSPILERALREAWGDAGVGVYELQHLDMRDVGEAVSANGLDPEVFWDQVQLAGVAPLAEKPVTLDLLIGAYRPGEPFPSTQSQLYLDGCLRLCEETNEERLDNRHAGNLSVEQRLAVAERIAAVTILGRKPVIRKRSGGDQIITHRELAGGTEEARGEAFPVTESAIDEVVGTALFSARGEGGLGWSHQTFGEFLAARYLVDHELRLPQVMDLLIHPDDPERKLVPQLHEVAAWVATMRPDVFREIMEIDPEVLLRSDAAAADERDRANLVRTLLDLYEREKVDPRARPGQYRYRILKHTSLAQQLAAYICDRSRVPAARYVAIDIAEACELRELGQQLADVVRDGGDVYRVRLNAAYAVSRIGDDDARSRLKPFTCGDAGADPDDEFKGCALVALWPGLITADELLEALTPPKNEHLIGAYSSFFHGVPMQHLAPADLRAAMVWVEQQAQREHLASHFGELIDDAMYMAWQHLDTPGVLDAFARAALALLRHHAMPRGIRDPQPLGEELAADVHKRRRVLEAMLPLLTDLDKDPGRLLYLDTPILLGEDVPWLLARLDAARSDDIQRVLAQLVFDAFRASDRAHLDAIYDAKERHAALAELFAPILDPIDLDSPRATRLRESYYKYQRQLEKIEDAPGDPTPAQRMASLLDRSDQGDYAAWFHLVTGPGLGPRSGERAFNLEPDLTKTYGWKTADPPTRTRILAAATSYLLGQEPQTWAWLGTNNIRLSDAAAYKALRLLLMEVPHSLSELPVEVWAKWASLTLAYPTSAGSIEEDKPVHRLVALAYAHAPAEVIDALPPLIDQDNSWASVIFVVRKLEYCWDRPLADAVLEKAKDQRLKPGCVESLLDGLLEHGFDAAADYARSILPRSAPVSEDRARAVVAARVLLTHREESGWSVVWPLVRDDETFGRAVASAVASYVSWHHLPFGERLSEEQLADLYLWLEAKFPHSGDEALLVFHSVTDREQVAQWRDSLLEQLRLRGTAAACNAISRISRELPELDWLKWTLLEARKLTRRETWQPPSPEHIKDLASNRSARLLQSPQQLLDVVVESLRGLEEKLQRHETRAARQLWDRMPSGKFRPVDENTFSDYLKLYLEDDLRQRGVVLAREVQIQAGHVEPGERTDIHVSVAVSTPDGSTSDVVTLVVEVKGCWHQKLKDAMRSQLLDRYLKNSQHIHGLYVVGWFTSEAWDPDDPRRARVPRWNLEQAQEYFGAQAEDLSRDGSNVSVLVLDVSLR